MVALRFDYRDLFRAPRLAFSFQRLWIQFLGLLVGYGGYVILTYLAFLIGGESLGEVWKRFGLLPCAFGYGLNFFGWVVFFLGVAFLVMAWLVTATAVSRAVYMNLKGNTFYTWKDAFAFARKKVGAVAATPAAIFTIIIIMAAVGVVVGVAGRIPYVGELGISLLAVIWYAASFFLVFVGLALLVAFLLTPSILAATDDDAFEGIFQSFSILASQPWRLVLYEALVKFLSLAAFVVFAVFAKQAWNVMTRILMCGMGDKFADLSFAATNLVQGWVLPAVDWIRYFTGDLGNFFLFSHDLMVTDLSVMMTISSVILAVIVFLIGMFVVSYPFATFNAGNTLLFLVLKKKKDDENLLERKDREEEIEGEEESKPEEALETSSKPKARRIPKRRRPVARKKASASRSKRRSRRA